MKVIIIEDEKLSAEHLCGILQKLDATIEVTHYFDTVKESLSAFNNGLSADLLFVDIHLADGNSFEIFSKLAIDIPLIFTTAYDHYAIEAFKQNSIDYLLKPINIQDVKLALLKFNKLQKASNKFLIENITPLYRQLNKQTKSRFMVKSGNNIDSIPTADIHHFDTQSSLSFLVTNKGMRYPIDYTLDQLETMLSPDDFFRINRKTILHIQAVEKVTGFFNSRLSVTSHFLDAESAIVSRDRVSDFKRWLDN